MSKLIVGYVQGIHRWFMCLEQESPFNRLAVLLVATRSAWDHLWCKALNWQMKFLAKNPEFTLIVVVVVDGGLGWGGSDLELFVENSVKSTLSTGRLQPHLVVVYISVQLMNVNIFNICCYSTAQECVWLIIFTWHDTAVEMKGSTSWDFPIYKFTNLQFWV